MAIVSLVERKTGLTLIQKVARKTAEEVSGAMIRLMRPLKTHVTTITSDNGREFAGHGQVASALSADFYFAHPHASWERGTNENTNGLIRQYFPKNRDFRTITDEEIDTAMRRLNHRPRKGMDLNLLMRYF
jgi:IS30 family transposase